MNDRSDQPRDPESGPVPGAEDPTVEQPRAETEPEAAGKPAEETATANAEQAPPVAEHAAPGHATYGATPPPGQAPWGAPAGLQAPPRQGGFRKFAGHRATQLVGVGLLGMLIGGGLVGGIAAVAFHDGGRPGIHRGYDGNGGPGGRDFRGPGFDGHGPGRGGPGNGYGG